MNSLSDYKWDFYTVNSHGKLVMGFNDEEYAKRYAKANRYRLYSYNSINKKNIDVSNLNNWTDAFPSKGLED